MNKNRFTDERLMQISSMKELRSTRRKVAVRLEILEDKFENGTWSLFNVDTMLYGLARKAAGIKNAWEGVKEIFRNLRGVEVVPAKPEQQPLPAKPKAQSRRKRKGANKQENPSTPVESAPVEVATEEMAAPEAEVSKPEAESKPKAKNNRRKYRRRKPKAKAETSEVV